MKYKLTFPSGADTNCGDHASPQFAAGTKGYTDNGQLMSYGRAGSTNITKGSKLMQSIDGTFLRNDNGRLTAIYNIGANHYGWALAEYDKCHERKQISTDIHFYMTVPAGSLKEAEEKASTTVGAKGYTTSGYLMVYGQCSGANIGSGKKVTIDNIGMLTLDDHGELIAIYNIPRDKYGWVLVLTPC